MSPSKGCNGSGSGPSWGSDSGMFPVRKEVKKGQNSTNQLSQANPPPVQQTDGGDGIVGWAKPLKRMRTYTRIGFHYEFNPFSYGWGI
ncbi:hypothetical protein L1049_021300 [Liquidambar formosana]|uniref:Uncharacterized protein n=1 Tax=Liquidambar formosana TaxID=63359 RepID=A0AAP0SB77_LIQFO